MVFLLTLSGLKFQTKEKIFLLTSFTKSAGTFNTEQLYTSLARAKFLMMAILPRIVKCVLDEIFRTFLSLTRRSSKFILFPTRTLYGNAIPSAVTYCFGQARLCLVYISMHLAKNPRFLTYFGEIFLGVDIINLFASKQHFLNFDRLHFEHVSFLTNLQLDSLRMFTCCLYWSRAVFRFAHESFAWNMAKTTVFVFELGFCTLAIWKAILNDLLPALLPTFIWTSSSGMAFSHVNLPFLPLQTNKQN